MDSTCTSAASTPGSVAKNTAPERPSWRGRTPSEPPSSSATERKIESPSPVPRICGSAETVATPESGSKIRATSLGATPGPSSDTESSKRPPGPGSSHAQSVITLRGEVNLSALDTRLIRIWRVLSRWTTTRSCGGRTWTANETLREAAVAAKSAATCCSSSSAHTDSFKQGLVSTLSTVSVRACMSERSNSADCVRVTMSKGVELRPTSALKSRPLAS
eukprot:Amastigsp_a176090_11.p2 type:complete len:219 gc:universal Amastigsp_a176090_11:601-1257(+)